ncbi:hypothetical protein A2686_00965 [Candidatus Woesebacteria bacterium RIFCSPHIGHO2_01_FULL_38_10]|uniref:Glycosyltransferase 2-like domain-containing protein n=1 Tax=Candidatus Woesebacteria bacterium RIFCSPLOWO2_01_FULL_39_10b TaxID=1802517 RepID=A0A1F8B9H3_9BACT|nr:MAG: hypothetical protein A2686_00965 [Candidatus Woesebacteria bacterium RIFCSPHIGHO2_01_FULL_38_10]OGM60677.1 MAG: hypothetical protein A2892_01360 [Candidatus Woesebacteria bacterium RIFCSPLOWO2_01_FULL_39_10b]
MKRTKRLTVTVGVPAYNEETNIGNLLKSVLEQKGNFKLEKLIVVGDGCTDKTARVVREYRKRDKRVALVAGRERMGKMARLNQIYEKNKSDIIFTFDADVVLSNEAVVETMLDKFRRDRNVVLVAAHQVPVKPETYKERIFFTAYRLWEETRIDVNGGDHIHNLQGGATALRRDLAGNIRYPRTVLTDQGYLYLRAREFGKFAYSYKSVVMYRTVGNLSDYRKLSARTLGRDQQTLVVHFGERIFQEYKIPAFYKLRATLKYLARSPFYTTCALGVNFFVRVVPNKDGIEPGWVVLGSTKKAIV